MAKKLLDEGFYLPAIFKETTIFSKNVTRVNIRITSPVAIKCHKILSKFVKSLTYEAFTLWVHFRLQEVTSIFW